MIFIIGSHKSYKKVESKYLVDMGFPYDLNSVMQYGSDVFKKNESDPRHVMLTKEGETILTGVSIRSLIIYAFI